MSSINLINYNSYILVEFSKYCVYITLYNYAEESAITIKVIFKLYYKIILPLNNKFSSLIQGVEEIILNNNNNKKAVNQKTCAFVQG